MDALDLLKADHERIKNLFKRAFGPQSEQQGSSLIQALKNELRTHFRTEEEIFYPAFSNYPDFKALIDRSLKEHQVIKNFINQLESVRASQVGPERNLRNLFDAFEQHIHGEETEFFQKVRKILKRSERERLGRHIQSFKQSSVAA